MNVMAAADEVSGQTQRRRDGPARVNHGQQEPAAPVSTGHVMPWFPSEGRCGSPGDDTAYAQPVLALEPDDVHDRPTATPFGR